MTDEDLATRRRYNRARLFTVCVGAAFLIATFAMFYALTSSHTRSKENATLLARLVTERNARIDEDCLIFERKQKTDVDTLKQTYAYLENLTAEQLKDPLSRAVLAGLPRTEAEAKLDDAPDYCDKPGAAAEAKGAKPIGLPEPDSVVPKRPASLKVPRAAAQKR
jgi:hypothetical protein